MSKNTIGRRELKRTLELNDARNAMLEREHKREWRVTSEAPYALPEVHSKLWVVEVATGGREAMPYHDAINLRLKLEWRDGRRAKPFDWWGVPRALREKLASEMRTKRNPWPGCHYSDDFNVADGPYVYKVANHPIGD